MEQGNKNKSIVPVLLIIIIVLVVLCVTFATGIIDFKTNDKENLSNITTTNNNTEKLDSKKEECLKNSDIVGKYVATFEKLDGYDENTKATVTLNLYDNGVFSYVFSHYAPVGVLGSYYVEGNNLILTYWFNTNSGVGLFVTKGTKKLTINDDGSITDDNIKNKPLVDNSITSVKLLKSGELKQFDLSNMLGTGLFSSTNHEIMDPAM